MEESFTEESFTVSSDITSEADDTVSLETAEIVNAESQGSNKCIKTHFIKNNNMVFAALILFRTWHSLPKICCRKNDVQASLQPTPFIGHTQVN